MKLYLSSYCINNSKEELIKWVNEHNQDILVIANALDVYPDGERKTNGILEKCQELENLGFHPIHFRAFYVLGGNVFVLRQAMKLSGFDDYLLEISNNPDYLYSGFSAGICVLATNLQGIHLADDLQQDPYHYDEIIWNGVGLIDYMPVPHFESPEHPESHLMYEVVSYLQHHHLKYKTLKDGDVILEDLSISHDNLNSKAR